MSRPTFALTGPLPTGMAVLEASAGTGKTYTIAALVARYVAEGHHTLAELMIVTFSRAATQELRARVRERLELTEAALAERVRAEDDVTRLLVDCTAGERERRRVRVATALAEFDAATIATTHEFCSRMLTGLGALADNEPEPTFVEDLSPLAREVSLDLYLARYATVPRPLLGVEEALEIGRAVARHQGVAIGPTLPRPHPGTDERVEFARAVEAELERRKRVQGIITYDDMLTRLATALDDPLHGPAARARLADRFPVVLIDEFQDTDPTQWRIVEAAFGPDSSATVILIGDPKQAIYAFRGADVHSYLAAVAAAPDVATLGRNWRSDHALVAALEALFAGVALGDEAIAVHPVEAAHAARRLDAPERWAAPLRLRMHEPAGEAPDALAAREILDRDLVADIRGLLASKATLDVDGSPRRVHPRDIAILVSRNVRGTELMTALIEAGVPAVFAGSDSVYDSEAARDWRDFLAALADPRPATVRQAALTSLVGWSFRDLALADDATLTLLGARMRAWAAILRDDGIPAVVEAVMAANNVPARLLRRVDGPRRLTDLRHVAQQLQVAAARSQLGAPGLVQWLADRIRDGAADAAEDRTRRLESDADAVQIMTVHHSKGLEFPIVYLPEAGDLYRSERDDGGLLLLHADDGSRLLDVGGRDAPDRTERHQRHEAEEAGEQLRKLYVGLTRAQCQVTVWWIPTQRNLASSPLHRLLARDLAEPVPRPSYDTAGLPGTERLRAAGVAIQVIDPATEGAELQTGTVPRDLKARHFERKTVDMTWRRTSYSGLTAGVHALGAAQVGKELDEPPLDQPDAPSGAPQAAATDDVAQRPSPMAALGGGVQFGSLVHAVLEHLDTTAADLPAELRSACAAWLGRLPVEGVAADALADALLPALRTPLGALADGRTLADIAPSDRLPELDFELPMGGAGPATLGRLADVIADHLEPGDPLAAYPDLLRAEGLGEQTLRGFLTGSIDAFLRVGEPGRYLVVDYKTNRIGPPGTELLVGHYAPAALAEAMMAAHYPLQALLYEVAAHRFLRWRQPGYRPDAHLGGVLYLFVRGMAGPDAVHANGSYGVFAWRPEPALIVALSDTIGGAR